MRMKRLFWRWFLVILASVILCFLFFNLFSWNKDRSVSPKPRVFPHKEPIIRNVSREYKQSNNVIKYGQCQGDLVLAVVLCGDRRVGTLVTLKSAAILTHSTLHFVIMADEQNRLKIVDDILDWPSSILQSISFEVHPISFPNGGSEWKKLFKLCASQRLFIPTLLPHIDSLVYVDTDVVILQSLDELWSFFKQMNGSQMAGLSPEQEDYATGWYNRFARHPYYKPLGVNSGVMLMNLTRMRHFQWQEYLQPILDEYKQTIVWGDQDIINIIFHFHPEKLFVFPCKWNYRPDHCMYTSVCKSAETDGVGILHGSRGIFSNSKQPTFKAIFNAFLQYEMGSNLKSHLVEPLKDALQLGKGTNCGKVQHVFTRQLDEAVNERQVHRQLQCPKHPT